MRLILEHTDVQQGESTRRVVIEVGHDDLSVPEMLEDMIRPALIAMTFTVDSLDKFLGSKEEAP